MIGKMKQRFDLATVRARLAEKRGRYYWRSLEELAETEEFVELLHREFPRQASEWGDGLSRRHFLKLMGASLALAGLTSCSPTADSHEKIVPYVRAPEQIIPGKPLFYATAVSLNGMASGVLVESHEGRPTKIEGNPDHPASLGATTAQTQASLLTMYDPDRSQVMINLGRISTWDRFVAELRSTLELQALKNGAGIRLLTDTITSPTLASQIQAFLERFPDAKWHQYSPVNRDHLLEGAKLVFGEAVNTTYRLAQADVILALDANFLVSGPASIRYAREFSQKRRVAGQGEKVMNRLYVVESTPTPTGSSADHRFALQASQIEPFARALAQRLGIEVAGSGTLPEEAERWLTVLVDELTHHPGQCVVIPGEQQSPAVHALVHAINVKLGNIGQTVFYTDPVEAQPVNQTASLRELLQDMAAGRVDVLFVLNGNPAYNAPADLPFASLLDHVPLRIHTGLYQNETAELCHWHIPTTHVFEAWGDTRAYDGTVTVTQPLIAPLYDSKSVYELMAVLLGEPASGYDIVRGYWQERITEGNFESIWRRALHDGLLPNSESSEKSLAFQFDAAALSLPDEREGLEIIFRPDPSIWDGEFSNNGWLQELPKPLTKLTWDNVALLSPATAERLGLAKEDVVELHYRGGYVEAPIWILPGHPADSVTVHLGYGRKRAGRVGTDAGFNAYLIRPTTTLSFGKGLEIKKTNFRYPLATTQTHHNMEGRHLLQSTTLVDLIEHPELIEEMNEHSFPQISLYPPYDYSQGYSWGMAVDLGACIGCNACVTACQAENNTPVVGKEQVLAGREMHWMRIDHYYEGHDLEQPNSSDFQPVFCMHCEQAPCEVVCPVAATVHDSEGLNVMVYNRCIGTRYCSDNCPYKVRRFNFFDYSDFDTESLKPMRNPNVTVRTRGVMEKCTYCVQRISRTRIEAEKEGREIRDGEFMTACEAACPTQAFVFGNLNDPNSRVSQLKADPLNYAMLGDHNTRPRTTYLMQVRNPNVALAGSQEEAHGEEH